jgi:predicted signal transduction protein with EAL and GGDEF domain
MGQATDAMPETDWLTGLSSRASFSRHCNQIDRDGDRFAVALFEVGNVAAINQILDHDAGDDLLRTLGRALAAHTSVDTVAARLSGACFALVTTGPQADDPGRWAAASIGGVRTAAADWTFDVIDQLGRCPVEPDLRIGVAAGETARTTVDAETALSVAKAEHHGPGTVVIHDDTDPRMRSIHRRRTLIDRLDRGLDNSTMTTVGRRIESVRGAADDWRWFRISGSLPTTASTDGGDGQHRSLRILDSGSVETIEFDPHDDLAAPAQSRLEDWLIERAGEILTSGDGALRLTVPVGRRVHRGQSFAQRLFAAVERFRLPPSRMLFEVTERDLLSSAEAGQEFVRRLDRIGSGVVVTGCGGGWESLRALDDLPVAHIRPSRSLVGQALAEDRAALSVLAVIVANLVDDDRTLISPVGTNDAGRLVELGFSYLQDQTPASIEASAQPEPT